MARYLLAFHGGGMPETEEETARVMAAWETWYKELGGAVVDPGNPVGPAMTVVTDGSVSNGGGANPVTGYAIIEAGSMQEAVEMSRICPILMAPNASVEVCETFEVM